jgi:hypothetical protein
MNNKIYEMFNLKSVNDFNVLYINIIYNKLFSIIYIVCLLIIAEIYNKNLSVIFEIKYIKAGSEESCNYTEILFM